MTGPKNLSETSTRLAAARQILNRTRTILFVFALASAAVLIVGLLLPREAGRPPAGPAASRVGMLLRLWVLMFFAAVTVVSAGLRWAAQIVAARRYKHADVYPAALVVAASQWAALLAYGVFEAAALYSRLSLHGGPIEFALAVFGAVGASCYFLRPPSWLSKGLSSTSNAPPFHLKI
jgi:hypothetical protein